MKISKMGVHLKVKDMEKSLAFYDIFNLNAVFAYGDKKWLDDLSTRYKLAGQTEEVYHGITFEIGGGLLEIADGHAAVKPEVFQESINTSKVSAYFDVDDFEVLLEKFKQNNIPLAVEPTDYPWGTREVVVRDPDGFILVFRTFIGKNYLEN